MLVLYQAADAIATLLFLGLGTWALFREPRDTGLRLLRGLSRPRRRLLFRGLGCVFCTWGWSRLFDWLWSAAAG